MQELLNRQPAKPGLPNRWTRTLRQHASSRGSDTGANAAAEQVLMHMAHGPQHVHNVCHQGVWSLQAVDTVVRRLCPFLIL